MSGQTLENLIAELDSHSTKSGKGLLYERYRKSKEVLINWITYLQYVILLALLLYSRDKTGKSV